MKDFSSPDLLRFIEVCAARSSSCPDTRSELAQEALIRVCQIGERYQHLSEGDQKRLHRRTVGVKIIELNRKWARYRNHVKRKAQMTPALTEDTNFKLIEMKEVLGRVAEELNEFEGKVLDYLINGYEFGEILDEIEFGRTTLCKALSKIRTLTKKYIGVPYEGS